MADVTGARTDWENVTQADVDANNAKAIANRHDATAMNGIGQAIHNVNNALMTAVLTGTGSPQGVVTANVGTKYLDAAATTGAIEWVKAVGAGNTGWEVSYGDTGWRRVVEYDATGAHVYGATLPADWEPNPGNVAHIDVRRIGWEVNFYFRHIRAKVANPMGSVYTVTSGFASSQISATQPLYMGGSIVGFQNALSRPGAQTMTAGQNFFATAMAYLTTDPWPTTLPGKPV